MMKRCLRFRSSIQVTKLPEARTCQLAHTEWNAFAKAPTVMQLGGVVRAGTIWQTQLRSQLLREKTWGSRLTMLETGHCKMPEACRLRQPTHAKFKPLPSKQQIQRSGMIRASSQHEHFLEPCLSLRSQPCTGFQGGVGKGYLQQVAEVQVFHK